MIRRIHIIWICVASLLVCRLGQSVCACIQQPSEQQNGCCCGSTKSGASRCESQAGGCQCKLSSAKTHSPALTLFSSDKVSLKLAPWTPPQIEILGSCVEPSKIEGLPPESVGVFLQSAHSRAPPALL